MTLQRRRALDWWVDHPGVDWWLVPIGLSAVLNRSSDVALVSNFAMGVATVGGVLLGMGSVVFTLYMGSTGPRFTTLRAFEGARLRATWFGVLASFMLASIASLVALVVADVPALSLAVAGCSAALLAIKAWRMVIILRYIMEISDREALEVAGGPPRRHVGV